MQLARANRHSVFTYGKLNVILMSSLLSSQINNVDLRKVSIVLQILVLFDEFYPTVCNIQCFRSYFS